MTPKAKKLTKAFLTAKGAKQREGFGLKPAARAEDRPDNPLPLTSHRSLYLIQIGSVSSVVK